MNTVAADIKGGKGIILRATGSVMKFPGFLAVYEEKHDDEEKMMKIACSPIFKKANLF